MSIPEALQHPVTGTGKVTCGPECGSKREWLILAETRGPQHHVSGEDLPAGAACSHGCLTVTEPSLKQCSLEFKLDAQNTHIFLPSLSTEDRQRVIHSQNKEMRNC